MKHDDTTLQAAIDAAMLEIGRQTAGNTFAASLKYEESWPAEQSDRLALAKIFLAKLPEPQPILADDGRSLGPIAHKAYLDAGGVGLVEKWEAAAQAVANVVFAQVILRMEAVPVEELLNILAEARGDGLYSLDAVRARLVAAVKGEEQDEADITDWKARAEKAEAELAALKSSQLGVLKSSQLGVLRPLSEAGPVPDGCVRVTALKNYEDEWAIGDSPSQRDTHFADIRLPVTDTPAPVNEQPKQQVPLGPEDVMPGSVFRSSHEHWFQAIHKSPNTVSLMASGTSRSFSFKELEEENWQINRSIPLTGRWDANAWEPCSKPGKEPTP